MDSFSFLERHVHGWKRAGLGRRRTEKGRNSWQKEKFSIESRMRKTRTCCLMREKSHRRHGWRRPPSRQFARGLLSPRMPRTLFGAARRTIPSGTRRLRTGRMTHQLQPARCGSTTLPPPTQSSTRRARRTSRLTPPAWRASSSTLAAPTRSPAARSRWRSSIRTAATSRSTTP